MTGADLVAGLRRLVEDLYAPAAFEARVLRLLAALGPRKDPVAASLSAGRGGDLMAGRDARPVFRDGRRLLIELAKRGPEEERLCLNVYRAIRKRPDCADVGLNVLLRYCQIRFMLDAAR
jgi:hypothetical protein